MTGMARWWFSVTEPIPDLGADIDVDVDAQAEVEAGQEYWSGSR
jgi:hypothetical protein